MPEHHGAGAWTAHRRAADGLPHSGGKAGIVAAPETADRPRLVRAFAGAISRLADYIPVPDAGTDETCMAWIRGAIGRAVGLPRVLGGIPLDEIGATGYGLAQCAEEAAGFCGLELTGATLAVGSGVAAATSAPATWPSSMAQAIAATAPPTAGGDTKPGQSGEPARGPSESRWTCCATPVMGFSVMVRWGPPTYRGSEA